MEALLPIRLYVSSIYLAAAIAYVLLLRSGRRKGRLSSGLLAGGLALHAVEILARGAEAGQAGAAPFTSLSGFLSMYTFLLGVVYFGLERRYSRYRIHSLGAFHVPVLFGLHGLSAALRQPLEEVHHLTTGPLFLVHVTPAIFAYAAFTVAFVAGIAYLFLDHQLRRKRTGVLLRGLPNLDLVERVNAAAVKVGTPLLVLAILGGLTLGYSELGAEFEWDPKSWLTVGTALVFGAQILLREIVGWSGRRSVAFSMVGFVAIVIGATLFNLYLSDLHGFG